MFTEIFEKDVEIIFGESINEMFFRDKCTHGIRNLYSYVRILGVMEELGRRISRFP